MVYNKIPFPKLPHAFILKILPVAIVLGWAFFYIALFDLARTRNRERVSILGTLFTFISSFCWFTYGLYEENKLVLFSSGLGILGSIAMMFVYFFMTSPSSS